MLVKLGELKKAFDQEILARMPLGTKKRSTVSWLERLDISKKRS